MQNNTHIKHKDHTTRQQHTTAVATKLMRSIHRTSGYDESGNKKAPNPPHHLLNNISERSAAVQRDIESIEQLLPDIKLAKQILISSILSPKDMGVSRITFSIRSSFPYQELGNKLIRRLDNFFTDDYKINELAPQQLEDILFTKGSHPELILPESQIDGLINQRGRVSLENCREYLRTDFSVPPLGLLNSTLRVNAQSNESVSLESLFDDSIHTQVSTMSIEGTHDLITIIDNPDVVKVPQLLQRIHSDKVKQAYSRYYTHQSTLESRRDKRGGRRGDDVKAPKHPSGKAKKLKIGDTDKDILEKLDTNRHNENIPFLTLRHGEYSDRGNVGHPLTMVLPHEAVIPAHTPGNPKDHVGYFLLIDQMGNFISTAGASDYLSDLRASFNNSNDENSVSSILREMKGVGGMQAGETNKIQSLQEATNSFAEILENDLLQRLRGGQQANNMSLARVDGIYQIMLARLFANQRTQLLYVPVEYLNYMAFNYTPYGTGKSLLEETRILASMRVMLMFANTMSAIRNSTAKTRVAINFDPTDSDPMGTAELVKSAFMRARSQSYPLGEGSPVAMMEYLNQAGVDVVYSGHPDLPEMTVDVTDEAKSRTMVDRDLEDLLRRQHIMGLGLSPEMVDITANVEFATTVINSSLMFAKQVAIYQKMYCHGLEGFITRFTRCSQPLSDDLKSIIDKYEFKHEDTKEAMVDAEDEDFSEDEIEAITDEVFDLFLDSVDVNLPAPDTITLSAQMEAFNEYSESIESALDAYITTEMQEVEGTGDYGEYVDAIRIAVKSIYQRRWLRENNVFPELDEIVQVDDHGEVLHDLGKEQHDHLERIMRYVDTFIQDVKESAAARDKRHTAHDEDLEARLGAEGDDGDMDSSDADDTGDEDTSGDDGGESDDFDFDDESDADDFSDDDSGSEDESDSGDDLDSVDDTEASSDDASDDVPEGDDVDSDATQDESEETSEDDGEETADEPSEDADIKTTDAVDIDEDSTDSDEVDSEIDDVPDSDDDSDELDEVVDDELSDDQDDTGEEESVGESEGDDSDSDDDTEEGESDAKVEETESDEEPEADDEDTGLIMDMDLMDEETPSESEPEVDVEETSTDDDEEDDDEVDPDDLESELDDEALDESEVDDLIEDEAVEEEAEELDEVEAEVETEIGETDDTTDELIDEMTLIDTDDEDEEVPEEDED